MKRIGYFKLRLFLKLHTNLYKRISFLSRKLNNYIHPKHKIMNYHQFFVDNIEKDSKILDIGCSIGNVTYQVAKKAQNVIGIDINKHNLEIATKIHNRNNIKYIFGDATKFQFKDQFDYIILSNILEHIKDRYEFLYNLKHITKFFLIRVPMLDRSWLVIYKKEFGLEYRLSPSHYIEYTFETFKKEIESVGLKIVSYSIQFGEIWAKVEMI